MAAMEAENLSLQIRDQGKRGDSKGGKGGESRGGDGSNGDKCGELTHRRAKIPDNDENLLRECRGERGLSSGTGVDFRCPVVLVFNTLLFLFLN